MKLTKIRLVNWHIFSNQTIEINGDTVISGENGHGKSTLIDAIYFILSGGDEKYFNNAANNESQRNLVTYVRCKVGVEGKTYNRNDTDVLCHIALEFTESDNKTKRILGCVIYVTENRVSKKHFYSINNLGVDEIEYVNASGEISDYDKLKDMVGTSFEGYASKRPSDIRKIIENLLQINDGNKYKQLLKKAIAFKPLNNEISSVVNEFLLNESRINIDDLKSEISSYRELAHSLQTERGKLECLSSFADKIDSYLNNKKELTFINAAALKSRFEKYLKEIENYDKKIDVARDNKNKACVRAEIEKNNLINYKVQIEQLKNDESFKVALAKKETLKKFETDLEFAEHEKREKESLLDNETNIAAELNLDYDFTQFKNANKVPELNRELREYKEKIESINSEKLLELASLNNAINENEIGIRALKDELVLLNKGINVYNDNINNLISEIKYGLKTKYKRDINVLPLCECFEINDERWKNAIEGYLNNQRFDLVVSHEYFDDALFIYDKVADLKRIYEVGLVDTTKDDDIEILENSLYTKINVLNINAETRLKSLLGRIVCVDKLSDLKKYNSSITDNCMLYKNYVARRLNPQRFAKQYIGTNSLKQRINYLKNQIIDCKNTNDKLAEKKLEITKILNVIKNSLYNGRIDITNVWEKVDDLTYQIDKIKDELKSLTTDPDFLVKQRQIEDYESKESETLSAIKDLDNKISDADSSIKSYTTLKEKDLEQKNQVHEEYLNEILKFADDDTEYKAYEESVLMSKDFNVNIKRNELLEENESLSRVIRNGMNYYYENYEKDLGRDIDDADKFLRRYNQIKNRDIAIFEDNAKDAFNNASKSFNEKFITVLRNKIKDAQKNIRLINSVLSHHAFGTDKETYSFTYSASGDKDLAKYYKIITNDKNYAEIDLFTESMNDEERDTIKSLFDKISQDTDDANALQDLETYLDYRNYMSYDIEIKNQNGDKYLFSKISKEKSGGETQTPFYIIIAACFEELIKTQQKESMSIIIFDEAFNNMDETRISTLLDYYRKLDHIQFLIAVPTNRLPLLLGQTDSCIGLVKKNNNVQIIYESSFLDE